jgi:hypothetical protein
VHLAGKRITDTFIIVYGPLSLLDGILRILVRAKYSLKVVRKILGLLIFLQANEHLELGIVVQAIEIGVFSGPLSVAVASRNRLF